VKLQHVEDVNNNEKLNIMSSTSALAIISDECSAAGNILEWDYPYYNGQSRHKPDITLKTNDDDSYVIELGITGERQDQIEEQYTRKDSKYHFIKPLVTELCIIIIGYIGSNTLESLNHLCF